MNEKPVTTDSAVVHLAGKLETEIDAIFRRGVDLAATREAVTQAMKHFMDVLSEHERERAASEKRVEHLASLITQAVQPFGEADYERHEKFLALKGAFRRLGGFEYFGCSDDVPF